MIPKKKKEGRKIYACLQQFSSRRKFNSRQGAILNLTTHHVFNQNNRLEIHLVLPEDHHHRVCHGNKIQNLKRKKTKKTQCGMRVPSVEPGVIPGRRRRRRRIHADHLLGKTFPLLPPPYYKQTAWNNPNCSGL